jgi:hypothetical protein
MYGSGEPVLTDEDVRSYSLQDFGLGFHENIAFPPDSELRDPR